jgi:hypothetical protein
MRQQFSLKEKLTQNMSQFGWLVAPGYRIETSGETRVIVPVWNGDWRPGVRAHYRPTLEPQLVEHFAAVGDEESLLAFASRYGLLGYRQLHPARETGEEKHRGEPVAWSLAHARTVAGALGVLQLIDAVRKGQVRVDDNSRKAVAYAFANEFHRAGIEGPHNDPQPGSVSFSYLSPENAIFGVDDGLRSIAWIYDWDRDPIGGAYSLLAWLVNPGIKDVHYELASSASDSRASGKPQQQTELGIGLTFDALLSVIYLRLAERVMSGEFRHCKECGRVFPAKGKQLFCPQPATCANRFSSRNYRSENRDKLNKKRRRTKKKRRKRK